MVVYAMHTKKESSTKTVPENRNILRYKIQKVTYRNEIRSWTTNLTKIENLYGFVPCQELIVYD